MSDICIDISHWQGYPDFSDVKAAGVLGMIHKATEGTSFVDAARAENCHNALQAGLAISTYFWLKPGDGRAQANFYLDAVQPLAGERCFIDYEENGCSIDTLHDAVQALLDAKLDLQVTVYSGHLLKEQLGNTRDEFLAANTDLWLAQYTEGNPSWPSGTYEQWTLWQYTDQGSVEGIDGSVDLDRFNGNVAAFLQWFAPHGAPPVPPPTPPDAGALVDVAIRAPENVDVRVTVNGKLTRRLHLPRRVRRGPDVLR